jgi:hypothetical protein
MHHRDHGDLIHNITLKEFALGISKQDKQHHHHHHHHLQDIIEDLQDIHEQYMILCRNIFL